MIESNCRVLRDQASAAHSCDCKHTSCGHSVSVMLASDEHHCMPCMSSVEYLYPRCCGVHPGEPSRNHSPRNGSPFTKLRSYDRPFASVYSNCKIFSDQEGRVLIKASHNKGEGFTWKREPTSTPYESLVD